MAILASETSKAEADDICMNSQRQEQICHRHASDAQWQSTQDTEWVKVEAPTPPTPPTEWQVGFHQFTSPCWCLPQCIAYEQGKDFPKDIIRCHATIPHERLFKAEALWRKPVLKLLIAFDVQVASDKKGSRASEARGGDGWLPKDDRTKVADSWKEVMLSEESREQALLASKPSESRGSRRRAQVISQISHLARAQKLQRLTHQLPFGMFRSFFVAYLPKMPSASEVVLRSSWCGITRQAELFCSIRNKNCLDWGT